VTWRLHARPYVRKVPSHSKSSRRAGTVSRATYRVELKPSAARAVRKLDSDVQRRVIEMNVVNLGEVYYRLILTAGAEQADARLRRFRRLPIDVLPVREALALSAAKIKAAHPISYADAFAIAHHSH
jgi:predicted nucleic acid-binding protein